MENYHRVAHIQLYVMRNFQFKYFKKEIPICLSPGLNTYKNFKVRMFWIKGLSLSYQTWLSRSQPHTGNQGPVFPSLSCHEERENRKYAQVWGSAGSNKSCSCSSLSVSWLCRYQEVTEWSLPLPGAPVLSGLSLWASLKSNSSSYPLLLHSDTGHWILLCLCFLMWHRDNDNMAPAFTAVFLDRLNSEGQGESACIWKTTSLSSCLFHSTYLW